MDSTRLVVQPRGSSDASCPFCRGAFAPGERVLACEGCQTTYHADCLRQELGRCSTLGCAGTRALPRAVPAPTPLEVQVRPARAQPPTQASTSPSWRSLAFAAGVAVAVVSGLLMLLFMVDLTRDHPLLGAGALVPAAIVLGAGVALAALARRQPVTWSRCAACDSSFAHDERLLACDGCRRQYHPACLRRVGRCAAPTCTGRRALPGRARAR